MDCSKKNEKVKDDINLKENETIYEHLKNLSSKKITELHNSIFNDNLKIIDQNNFKNCDIYNNESSSENCTKNNSSQIRISSLEIRLDKSERLLKFFEEIIKIKEHDRDNEIRIDTNKITELNKRIIILEDNIKSFQKKLHCINDVFCEKFSLIEKKYNTMLNNKDSIAEFYSNKLNDIENILKKNEAIITNSVETKLEKLKGNLDSK